MTQAAAVQACREPGILRMDFQPIIDTARGTVVGYESLARFSGPPHTTPDRWFAVARAAGVGAELEAQAVRTALRARSALPPNCFLSVNVGPEHCSPRRLPRSSPAPATCAASSSRSPSRPRWRTTMPCATRSRRCARQALLAVDDAGAGFASLKHITLLRPDFVKVDRDLVAGATSTRRRPPVVVSAPGCSTSPARRSGWSPGASGPPPSSTGLPAAARAARPEGYGLGSPRPVAAAVLPHAVALCRRRSDRRHLVGGLF
jgi:predicted signal transduction protein with EAL and GGDEF domain